MRSSIFALFFATTILLANGNEVSDKVLQWLKAENGQPLHMFPSSTLDRQAVSLGRLFKRADMIRLLKRSMLNEDQENFYMEQEPEPVETEDMEYPVSKRGMVRLLRSGPNRQLRLLRSEMPELVQEKKATKMVRLL